MINAFAGSNFFVGSGIAYGIVSGPYQFPISSVFQPSETRRFIDTEPIAPDIEPIDQEDKRLKGLFDDKPKEKKMGEKEV